MNRKNKYHRLIKAFKKKIPEYRKSPELFAYEVCRFEPDKWQKEVFADIAKFPKVSCVPVRASERPVVKLFCAYGFFHVFRILEL